MTTTEIKQRLNHGGKFQKHIKKTKGNGSSGNQLLMCYLFVDSYSL